MAAFPALGAAVVTTDDGFGADTYLSNDGQNAASGPNGVHGEEAALQVRNYAGTRMRMAYVRFDLSDASGDLTGGVLSFQLTSTGNRDRTFQVWGLTDNLYDDAWGETTTSYNTAAGVVPTSLGQLDIDESRMTLLGTIGMNGSAAQVVRSDNGLSDSTLNLNAFLAADTNDLVTFLIINSASDSGASYSIVSRESTTAGVVFPTLELPNAVPEPVGASTLAAAGAWALTRRRRRHA